MKTDSFLKTNSIYLIKGVILLLGILIITTSLNIERTIHGTVISATDHKAIPGVNILLVGTNRGTITDINGQYNIEIPSNKGSLSFSYVGFLSQIIEVSSKDSLNVMLQEDVSKLEEVVVVGYGTIRKSSVTGATSSVSVSEDISSDFVKDYTPGLEITKSDVSVGSGAGYSSETKNMEIVAVKKSFSTESAYVDVSERIPNNHHAVSDNPSIAPGILTAGEINDFTKWKLWQDIGNTELNEWQSHWQIKPEQRFTLQIISEDGKPVIDCIVKLLDHEGNIVWQTKTDNTGKAELWANIFSQNDENKFSMMAELNGQKYEVRKAKQFHDGINILKIKTSCNIPAEIDAMFVVDATGSMGDELEFLKTELNDVISRVKMSQKDIDMHLGSVFYRDYGDDYLTRKSDFSTDISQTVNFIKAQSADGGGDFPEAVDAALELAINGTTWSETARARLLFLVLDAPPHHTDSILVHLKNLISSAAKKGIRIIPITGSGSDKSTEYLMRSFALATNGTYVFLTDHSHVGDHHIEPTTDKYDVKLLNKLLVNLFDQYAMTPDCNNELPKSTQEEKYPMNIVNDDTLKKVTNENPDSSEINESHVEPIVFKSLKYFPNPTKGQLNIEIDGNISELYLADISGKILQQINTNNMSKIEINISQYPTGIYFIKYPKGLNWLTGKIILQH